MRSFLNFNLSVLTAVLILQSFSFPQEPGEPFHPMTAPGANGVAFLHHTLHWQNPEPTHYNKIYFSDKYSDVNTLDSSALLLNGYPDSAYTSILLNNYGYLDNYKNYYWRVVEYSSNDSTIGPVWRFKTRIDASFGFIINEDFEDTIDHWTINNLGGDCDWMQVFPPYPNTYSMPDSNSNGLLVADADECGSSTTTLSEAIINVTSFGYYVDFDLVFDIDFRYFDFNDEVRVEISTDSGSTWALVWNKIGENMRQATVTVNITSYVSSQENYLLKFISIQPGFHWWCALDNIRIHGFGVLTPNTAPGFLSSFGKNSPNLHAELEWTPAGGPDPITSYRIERKEGLPLDSTEYIQIAEVDETVLSYIDTAVVKNQAYTYRVRAMHSILTGAYSNEATAYIPDFTTSLSSENESVREFHLAQNYPNPFNPSTTIKFTIPTSPLNPSPYQGEGNRERLVSLKVYDILGNEVATLVNEYKPAGSYEVEFDAERLSSGIYFYKINAGEYSETKKMILLK